MNANLNGDIITNNGGISLGSVTQGSVYSLQVNGEFMYSDGSEVNGYLLVSDANGRASWADPLIVLGTTLWVTTGSDMYVANTSKSLVIGGSTTGNSNHNIRSDGSAVINERSRPRNIRVESDNRVNMIRVRPNDRVGFGIDPSTDFQVGGTMRADDVVGINANITNPLIIPATINATTMNVTNFFLNGVTATLINGAVINGTDLNLTADSMVGNLTAATVQVPVLNGDTINGTTFNYSTLNTVNVHSLLLNGDTINGTNSYFSGLMQANTANVSTSIQASLINGDTVNGDVVTTPFLNVVSTQAILVNGDISTLQPSMLQISLRPIYNQVYSMV